MIKNLQKNLNIFCFLCGLVFASGITNAQIKQRSYQDAQATSQSSNQLNKAAIEIPAIPVEFDTIQLPEDTSVNPNLTNAVITNYEAWTTNLNDVAKTAVIYLTAFALIYGTIIMHEFGHAVVFRHMTGSWPKMLIGKPDKADPYTIIDTEKFKWDISDCFGNKGAKCRPQDPAVFYETEKKFATSIGSNFASLPLRIQQLISLEASAIIYGKTITSISLFAGPLAGLLSLLAVHHYLPDQGLINFVWHNQFMRQLYNLVPINHNDGHGGLYSLGLRYVGNIPDQITFIAFKTATFFALYFTKKIWDDFYLLDLCKYIFLHQAIVSKNISGKLMAATMFTGLVVIDHFIKNELAENPTAKTAFSWLQAISTAVGL